MEELDAAAGLLHHLDVAGLHLAARRPDRVEEDAYGLYVEDSTAATNNWAVYTAGTTKSYFGGNVGIGTTGPQSALHVPDGKYVQAEDNNAGAPPAGDCDADAERGRLSIDTTNNRLYVCNGATRGWDYVALTD